MIAAPPFEAGAVQDKLTWPLPAVAVSPVGGPGFITRACGPCRAVSTMPGPPAGGPATLPPVSVAGQPARKAARHSPASDLSHRWPERAAVRPGRAAGRRVRPGARPGRRLLARRRDFMRTPA